MNALGSVLRELGGLLSEAARTFLRFLTDALRVLAAQWPQLIGLFLAGWTGRMIFLWLATAISDFSPTLAALILPLAPMATLLSFVLMMRAMAPTLPAFSGLVETASRRERLADDFTVAGQVMIPFLAVYASAGLLRQDVAVFLLDSTADEGLNTVAQDIDWGRADYAPGLTIIAFIVVALVLRKVIAMRGLAERRLVWAGLAAYLEVLWIMTLAQALTSQLSSVEEWVTSRRAVATVIEVWDGALATVRGLGTWASAPIDAVGTVLTSLGAVVLVPVAWLAIGASVYGQQLKSADLKVAGHEEMTRRIKQLPNPVRRAASHVVEPVVTPVQSAVEAIRKVAVAGILPMVMFCVAFLVAGGVESAVAVAMRDLIGPGPALRQFALEPFATMAERGVYFLLALTLLAAAVNAVVMAQRAEPKAALEEAPAEPAPQTA